MDEAGALERRGRQIAAAKQALEQRELESHLALSPGERLWATLLLSAAHLEACPPHPDPAAELEELEVRRRVWRHMQAHR